MDKIDKFLAGSKKKEIYKYTKLGGGRKNHNQYHRNTKNKIITELTEQQIANKLDKVEKMDKFPEAYSLPKLNQKEQII